MGDACRAMNTPVTGGNVSFHNESKNFAVYPTPTIGTLGIIDDINKTMSYDFKDENDLVFLIGNDRCELGGSEYLKQYAGKITGKAPIIDINEEIALQKLVLTAIRSGVIKSAHDTSEGGIAICLAEKAMNKKSIGCEIDLGEINIGKLFGESHSRVIVSIAPEKADELNKLSSELNVPVKQIGKTIKDKFIIKDYIETSISEISNAYENAIPEIMSKKLSK